MLSLHATNVNGIDVEISLGLDCTTDKQVHATVSRLPCSKADLAER